MKYYLDTEFIERPGVLKLISIGLVDENGREYYAESSEFSDDECNDWVRANVLPKLGRRERRLCTEAIAFEVRHFVNAGSPLSSQDGSAAPEFWGYYADYDWVLFCWLFGAMVDLPSGWPMFCRDLKQLMEHWQLPKSVPETGEHHALADARWVREQHQQLIVARERKRRRMGEVVAAAVLRLQGERIHERAAIVADYNLHRYGW